MGHNTELALGWYVIVGVWAIVILATVAVFIDSMLGYRRRRVARHASLVGYSREPLWFYTAASGVIIAIWIASVLPLSESYVYTMSVAAALAAIASVVGVFTYLLRIVVPRVPDDKVGEYLAAKEADGKGGRAAKRGAEVPMTDRHDVTVIEPDDMAPTPPVAEHDTTDAFELELFADDSPKGA